MGCHPKPIDELHHFSRWFIAPPTSNVNLYQRVNPIKIPLNPLNPIKSLRIYTISYPIISYHIFYITYYIYITYSMWYHVSYIIHHTSYINQPDYQRALTNNHLVGLTYANHLLTRTLVCSFLLLTPGPSVWNRRNCLVPLVPLVPSQANEEVPWFLFAVLGAAAGSWTFGDNPKM